MIREGRVFISTAGKPAFALAYYVTAYEVGAVVAFGSSGNTVTVDLGHGFAAGDKFIVGIQPDLYKTIRSVTSTTLVLTGAETVTVSAGDVLVNLGPDTGSTTPNWDGSGAVIYTDMDYNTVALYSTVQTSSVDENPGRYSYHHKGIARWELVRVGNVPTALYRDTGNPADEDQVSYGIRYAHLFATSGSGTSDDPWPGQAIALAWADLPNHMGTVKMLAGVFDLGSASVGLNFDYNGTPGTGFTLEGAGGGNEFTGANTNDGATVLRYRGVGEAIRIGNFNSSANTWLENSVLRGFKLQQVGTAGTGIGILARVLRWSVLEDINFVDFAVGCATASVSDFLAFKRCRSHDCRTYHFHLGRLTDAAGNLLGGTGGQCNANRFTDCDIKNSERDLGYTNWGIFITNNCVLNTIQNSEFHNFDTSTYGAIRNDDGTTDSNSLTVDNCYFEGNYVSVYHNNPLGGASAYHRSVTVTNNYFAQIEAYGVWINSGGAGGPTDGIIISGNTFDVPSSAAPYSTAIGIQLGTYTQNAWLFGNSFSILNVVGTLPGGNIQHGSLGSITQNNFVMGSLRQTGALALGASLTVGTTLGVTGASTLTGAVGCGALTSTGDITSGGHLQGLLATQAFTGNDTIAHGGRTVVDITNTSGSNTLVVAAPSSVDGKILILRVKAITAGSFVIADSGNCSLSAAWDSGVGATVGSTLTLIASGSIWYEIARSKNT